MLRLDPVALPPGGVTLGAIDTVTSFGEDGVGELLIVDSEGEVFRVVPEPGSAWLALAALITLQVSARWRHRV